MSACMNYRADLGRVIGVRWDEFAVRAPYTVWVPWYHGEYRKPVIDFQI